jgi:hypothetical protein
MATLATLFDKFTLARSAAPVPVRDIEDDFRVRPFANEGLYYFVKAIDNSGVVRQDDPRARQACWKAIGAGVVTAMVLLCLTLPNVLGVLWGYQLQALRDERQTLETKIAAAKLDETRMLGPAQLDKVAQEHEFAAPAAGRMVYLDNRDGSHLAKNVDGSATVAAR